MRAYFIRDGVEYNLTPLTEFDFRAAFCIEFDGAWLIKAIEGFPCYFVPEDPSLLWPIPPKGFEIILEEAA